MNGKTIIDTSVWIEFFRGKNTRQVLLTENLISNNNVVLIPVIIQEILQGVVTEKDYEKVKELITGFDIINGHSVEAAIGAADIYRLIRKKGATMRKSNDCLIAWYGLKYKCSLLHNDKDFDIIAKFFSLKIL